MTEAQQARIEGFRASLSVRGIRLKHPQGELQALIEPVPSELGEYAISGPDEATERLSMLRVDLASVPAVRIGDSFLDESGGLTYRVTRVRDHPASVVVEFDCEPGRVA